MLDLKNIATAYALNRGWSVFPVHGIDDSGACTCGTPDCPNAGKHSATGNGLKSATKDARGVGLMFKPGHNIAIATGEASGFWVLDIDGQAGETTLAGLEAEHGALPGTLVHFTGNGRHLFFRWPGVPIKNSVKKLGDGLDVRGDGGYIVAAPSRHRSGVQYRFANIEAPIADAPDWLLAQVRRDAAVAMPGGAMRTYHPAPERELTADQAHDMLSFIVPDCDYQTWIEIGMGLHAGGYPVQVWDDWSRGGAKYQAGDCYKRWKGFKPGAVTFGSVWHHARANGWSPDTLEAPKGPHPAAGFLAKVRGRPPVRTAPRGPAERVAGNAQAPVALRVVDPTTLDGIEPPPRKWVVRDWIPDGVVTALYGDGGAGKSLLALQLMTATARGLPFLGMETTQRRCLAVFCEDDEDEIHRRLAKLNAACGASFQELGDFRYTCRVGDDNIMLRFDGKDVGVLTPFFDAILAEALRFDAGLVVIDTAADTFGGNEIIRPQVRQYISNCLGRIAKSIHGAVVMLAHPSVAGMTNGTGSGGSTAWSNTVRSRLYLTRPDEGAASNLRILSRKKSNYGDISGDITLRWEDGVFQVENASAMDAVARLQKCERDAEVDAAFLETLDLLASQGRNVSYSKNAKNYAPKEFFGKSTSGKYTKADFEAAMERLFAAKKIKVGIAFKGADRKKREGIVRAVTAAEPEEGLR